MMDLVRKRKCLKLINIIFAKEKEEKSTKCAFLLNLIN